MSRRQGTTTEVELEVRVACPACGNPAMLPKSEISIITRCYCKACKTRFQIADQNATEAKAMDDYRLAVDVEDSILIV